MPNQSRGTSLHMSTTRATMKHAAVYSATAMTGRVIGLFMLPFYAHILRGHGYAVIGMLDVGLGFLLSLLAYGMQRSIIRLYHDQVEPRRKKEVVSTGVILIGGVTALVTLPLIALSKPISTLLVDDGGLYPLTIMALLGFNFDMWGHAAAGWLVVRSRSTQLAWLSLLRVFLGLSLNIYLILILNLGLEGYFLSSMITSFISGSILVYIAFRGCGRRFQPGIARSIRDFILPLVPGAVASWIGRQAERVLAKVLINLESVGILEMGYRFPMLISMVVIQPFMRSWETRRYEIAEEPDAPETIARMFTYFMFMLVWVGLMIAVIVKPLLVILTPPEFHISYRIAQVETLTVILLGANFHLIFGLVYAKDTPTISKLRIIVSGLKVVLSWVFISTWGLFGAAFSALVTGAIHLGLVFHFSQKRYHLPLEWNTLAVIGLAGGGFFLALNNWDFASTTAFRVLDGDFIPWLQEGLQATPLGAWKDGKLVTALDQGSQALAEVLLKGASAAAFIILLPLIHRPTRNNWQAKLWGAGK